MEGGLKGWLRRNGMVATGIAAGTLVALWSVRGVWGDRAPAGEDVMAHLVRLDWGVSHLVAHGRLDGWFPRFYLGYQEFLFNGPGLAWIVAVVRGVTFGTLSNTGALKIVGAAAFVALPATVAFAARSVGLGRRAAGIAAVLALLVSNVFGVGLEGLYVVGLVPHQVGAVFFFLALGALLRVPVDRRRRWVVTAGVSLSALLVTHLISVMVLAVVLPLLGLATVRLRPGRDGFARLAFAGAVGAGLAGWWLVPFLAHRDLRGEVATWVTPPFGERLRDLLDGRILLRPHTGAIVVVAGLAALLRVRHRRPFAVAVVIAPVAYLGIAHWTASRWPGNEVAVQLANRGLGYAGILAVLPLAAVLAAAARAVPARAAMAADVAVLAVAVALVVSPLGPDRDVARQFPEAHPALREAAAWLRRSLPDGARFATARDYPGEVASTGILHPETWLTRVSGRDSLNGFNLESSSTPAAALAPDRLLGVPADRVATDLARYGVSHLVTTTGRLTSAFRDSDRFRVAWQQEPVTIFEVTAAPAALVVEVGTERARVETRPTRPTNPTTIPIAWTPKWDGGRVDLERSPEGLVEVDLPVGETSIALTYRADGWDRLGLAVSALTLAVLAGWAAGLSRWPRSDRGARRAAGRAPPRARSRSS